MTASFDDVLHEGGVTNDATFMSRAASLLETERAVLAFPFPMGEADRMIESIAHATDHGCPDSLIDLWWWLTEVLGPTLQAGVDQQRRLLDDD